MDELLPIIEQIGQMKDKAESSRWELAEVIHSAYAEFPQYERGLTAGLCQRLKYTPANLYNYKNAWTIRSGYIGNANLSVSHYSKLYDMIAKYNLTDHDVLQYIELAEDEAWSVLQMAREISDNHSEDTNEHYLKSIRRLILLIVNVLNDPENNMDEFLRANLYDVKKELEKI